MEGIVEDEILVSVVMTAYNEEHYITQSINSILKQSYRNLELILINDGSTDRTAEIIQSFSDPRIIFINHKENKNQAIRANEGVSLAKGKYIARLDADDISLPDRLEKQVKYLEAHTEISILGGQISIWDENSNSLYPYKKLPFLTDEVYAYMFFFALLCILL